MGQAASSSFGCAQAPACFLQPGGAVSSKFAAASDALCSVTARDTGAGTHDEGGPTPGLQQAACWADARRDPHSSVHCLPASAFDSASVASETGSSAKALLALWLVTLLYERVLPMQAVEDMCLHKMADKLYQSLQQVRVWNTDCWL